MTRFKETLADLRRMKREGRKLTRKQRFRLLASRAAKRYHKKEWSSWEVSFKKLFEEWDLRENRDWVHNYPIFNERTSKFYLVDFIIWGWHFLDGKARAIEVSPKIWHINLGETEEKDRKKKKLLESLGFKVVIFGTEIKLTSKTKRIRKSDKEVIKEAIFW